MPIQKESLNSKLETAIRRKKFESFMNLFDTVPYKNNGNKKNKIVKTETITKNIKNAKKHDICSTRYDIDIIINSIPQFVEMIQVISNCTDIDLSLYLQDLSSPIKSISNIDTVKKEEKTINSTKEYIEYIQNNKQMIKYMGNQGPVGDRGPTGKDGILLSSKEKYVTEKLETIIIILDKIIEKIKYVINNNET